MKVIWIILTICLLLSANLVLCGQESSNLLSSAIYEEEINGDLKKAMNLYEQIVNKYPEERSVAAESLLRLGIACEKLGRTRAQEYYQKILSNYPDQTNFVKSAQLRLQRIKSFLATKFPSNSTLLAPTFPKMFKSSKVYYPGMAVRSISPDGRYLSQVSALGNLAIYDRIKNEIRKLTPDPINKDKGRALGAKGLVSMSTIWSPDSKKIAFFWVREDSGEDMRIFDLESGNVKILCPFNEQGAPIPLQWTKDGAYILGEINNPKSNMLSIVLVNAEKGSIQTIKTLPDNKNRKGILKASISDDNRYILYDDLNEGNKKDLNIIGVDGKLDAIYLERPIRQTMILFGSMITGVFCL